MLARPALLALFTRFTFLSAAASADKSITAKEKMDLIMFRTKSFGKYWNFGVQIIDVIGEQNKPFIMVEVSAGLCLLFIKLDLFL